MEKLFSCSWLRAQGKKHARSVIIHIGGYAMAHILLAEDDTAMRRFLGRALENAGHEVTVCADGVAAHAALMAGQNFDLLLADIVMTGMDGIELAMKAGELAPKMKVMFITGFAAVAMGQQSQVREGSQVMQKPFHLRELVDKVNQMLGE